MFGALLGSSIALSFVQTVFCDSSNLISLERAREMDDDGAQTTSSVAHVPTNLATRLLTTFRLAWTVMNENILSPWIAPDSEDESSGNPHSKGPSASLVSQVRCLIARPFAREHATLARSSLVQLTKLAVLYTNITYVPLANASMIRERVCKFEVLTVVCSGPEFCCLPLDLQNRLLQWIGANINALELLVEEVTSLLRAIYVFHSSHGKGSHPLCTFAASLLESLSKEPMVLKSDVFPNLDAFAVALQTDLLTRLDSTLILLPGSSHHRGALFELGDGQSRSDSIQSGELHVSLMIDDNDPSEEDIPAVFNLDGYIANKADSESQPLDGTPFGTMETDEDTNFESQLPTSSQHDTINATMDMDVDLPTLHPESPTSGPALSTDDRVRVLELEERLSLLDAHPSSQSRLDRPLVAVILETSSIDEAIGLLDLNSRSDDVLLALLQIVLSEDVSYAGICSILSGALSQRVSSLTKAASRTLMNLLSFAAEKDARALLDSVLLPIACSDGFASPHVELMIRVVKGLPAAMQDLYLEKLLESPKNFALPHLDFVSKILPLRPTWNASLLRIFIVNLHRHLEDSFGGGKVGEKFQAIVWVLLQKGAAADFSEHKDTLTAIVRKYPSTMADKSLAKLAQM